MNCPDCREQIARAARAGAAPAAVLDHLARCPPCRRFAVEMVEATAALALWEAPQSDSAAARAVLVGRLAADRDQSVARGSHRPINRVLIHPAVLAAPAAAAILTGASMAPGWVQQVAAGWIVLAAVLVSLVLVQIGCGTSMQGERQ
jgi:hypothetical protein